MSSISSVAAGAGASLITSNSGGSALGNPGQSVEPSGLSSSSVPLLYYTSPRIFVDPQYGEVVYDYRDLTTGASTNQVPSKHALSAYRAVQSTPSTNSAAQTATSAPIAGQAAATAAAVTTPTATPVVSAQSSAPVSTGSSTSTVA